ncbi:MAG: ACT domain-containing protein, partial [Promethearchaeota archaeon]
GKLFSLLGNHGININMISQSCSQIDISFAIERYQLEKAIHLLTTDESLPSEWISISHQPVGIIAIIGNDIFRPESILRISKSIAQLDISPISIAQNDNGMNLSIALPETYLEQIVNLINDSFVSTEEIPVFIESE